MSTDEDNLRQHPTARTDDQPRRGGTTPMTTNRTRLLQYTLRALLLVGAVRAGVTCDRHHLPLLLTLTLFMSMVAGIDQAITVLIYRERTVACPAGCGVSVTATREDADTQKAIIRQHQRTAHADMQGSTDSVSGGER